MDGTHDGTEPQQENSGPTIEQAKRARRRARGDSPYVDGDAQRVLPDSHADGIEDQVLTARDGVSLREDVATPKGRAPPLAAVVDEFEHYIWTQWKAANTTESRRGFRPTGHRFAPSYSRDLYARTLGADRLARKLWGDDLTTVHVVRRASAWGENNQPQPMADHLADLTEGNSAAYEAYKEVLRDGLGLQYARLTVLEPHANGYAHVPDALWIHDPRNEVSDADILPAVEAHLDAVPQAAGKAHELTAAITVKHSPERRRFPNDPPDVPPCTALPREMTKDLAGLMPRDGDAKPKVPPVLQATRGRQRFYATLWARGVPQWRPDRRTGSLADRGDLKFGDLVKASQAEWGNVEPDRAEAVPDGYGGDRQGRPMVDVDGRPVEYDRPERD